MRAKHIAVCNILSYGVLREPSLDLLPFLFSREGSSRLPERWMALSGLWLHCEDPGLEKAQRKVCVPRVTAGNLVCGQRNFAIYLESILT